METKQKPKKRRFVGIVRRDKNEQSIVVEISWSQKHPIYKKARRRITRLVAHDPMDSAKVGDSVVIEQHRPLSATKRWKLVEIVDKGGN